MDELVDNFPVSVTHFKRGSVLVIDLLCGNDVHYYVKEFQGLVEYGGTAEWGTGTIVEGCNEEN